ncbi:unnamed protein product [Urochloa decumbens]|uniref:Uncharacterized protein n=1 Tax=Urochloa decumbens TaxID=240449 RepID=A0ABC8ZL76_9POAL
MVAARCCCDVGVDAAAAGVLGGEHGGPTDRSRSRLRSGQRAGASELPPLLLWPSSDGAANITLGGMAMAGRAGLGAAAAGSGDGKPAVLDVVSPLAAAAAAALPPPLSGRCVCGSMPRLRSLRLMCVFQ